MEKTYEIREGCYFTATSDGTIAKIQAKEAELLDKATAEDVNLKDGYLKRIKNDPSFRTRQAVIAVLKSMK